MPCAFFKDLIFIIVPYADYPERREGVEKRAFESRFMSILAKVVTKRNRKLQSLLWLQSICDR